MKYILNSSLVSTKKNYNILLTIKKIKILHFINGNYIFLLFPTIFSKTFNGTISCDL